MKRKDLVEFLGFKNISKISNWEFMPGIKVVILEITPSSLLQ